MDEIRERVLRADDIAARIPHRLEFIDKKRGSSHIATSMNCVGTVSDGSNYYDIETIMPLLYSEVPRRLWAKYEETLLPVLTDDGDVVGMPGARTIEFCNANQIDYLGLVRDGLALDKRWYEENNNSCDEVHGEKCTTKFARGERYDVPPSGADQALPL